MRSRGEGVSGSSVGEPSSGNPARGTQEVSGYARSEILLSKFRSQGRSGCTKSGRTPAADRSRTHATGPLTFSKVSHPSYRINITYRNLVTGDTGDGFFRYQPSGPVVNDG